MYWRQFIARDPKLVEAMLKPNADIQGLVVASLGISAEEEERVQTTIYALAGLDFLELAEKMKTVATSMPFTGLASSQLRKDLSDIASSVKALALFEPPGAVQVEELTHLLP